MTDLKPAKRLYQFENYLSLITLDTSFLNSRSAVQSCPSSPTQIYFISTLKRSLICPILTLLRFVLPPFTETGMGKHWEDRIPKWESFRLKKTPARGRALTLTFRNSMLGIPRRLSCSHKNLKKLLSKFQTHLQPNPFQHFTHLFNKKPKSLITHLCRSLIGKNKNSLPKPKSMNTG